MILVCGLASGLLTTGCVSIPPLSRQMILPGQGVKGAKLWDPPAAMLQRFGKPDKVRKESSGNVYDYRKRLGIEFYLDKRSKTIGEVHFEGRYRGKTPDGIGLGSRLETVIQSSGGALKRVVEPRERLNAHGRNRVLVQVTNPKPGERYRFTDTCRGIGYWFGKDKRVRQIHVFGRAQLCACRGQRTGATKAKHLSILAGQGTRQIRVGDRLDKIQRLFGKPERRVEHTNVIWLVYWTRHGIDFLVSRRSREILEVRFNPGYTGSLANSIGLCTPLNKVLRLSGGARKMVSATPQQHFSFGTDRVLYKISYKGSFKSYLFRDGCRGILYWFDRDKRVSQIVAYHRSRSCACVAGATPKGPAAKQLLITAGRGNGVIRVGDTMQKAIQVLGQPERRKDSPNTVWLVYWKRHQLDVLAYKRTGTIFEVRFNATYRGRLANGVGLCSKINQAVRLSGGAQKTVRAPRKQFSKHGTNRVLYELARAGIVSGYLFRDGCRGIIYWADESKRISQIVASRPSRACACRPTQPKAANQPQPKLGILPRRGNPKVQLGDMRAKVIRQLGPPDLVFRKKGFTALVYRGQHATSVLLHPSNHKVVAVRFHSGYRGRLRNGIGLCSTLADVLKKSGGAKRTIKANRYKVVLTTTPDRVLVQYTQPHNDRAYLYRDHRRGLTYVFGRDKRVKIIEVKR